MENIGYETHNTILNLSTLYFVMWFYLVKVMIFGILHVSNKRNNRLYMQLRSTLFWGEILTIMMEGFMELYISGYLEYQYPLSTLNGEKQARVIGYLCLFLSLVLLPSLLSWVLYQNKEKLEDKDFEQ